MASAGSSTIEATGSHRGTDALPKASRRVLLVSNRVMHYRVSVYNYFWRRYREHGWEFIVLTNELQRQNQNNIQFELVQKPFVFSNYRREILRIDPDAVILFLHLKDRILWPLIHWLKFSRIPVAIWTKTRNLEDPDNRLRNLFFDYLHVISDGIIVYTASLQKFLWKRLSGKVFIANNTINFEEFPQIQESKEQIKREMGIPFKKVVLFAGRIGEEKNRKKVDHLIDIFRELDRTDIGLLIVGAGLTDDLRARMNHANTVYLGEVHDPENSQISRIFKMADICSIPGHVGLGLNQALFWGLPMVTGRGKQPPEIEYLHDGENGFIVPENDRSALRDRLLYLLDNDDVRMRMSRNAQRSIRREASIDGMFRGFLSCVNFIARERKLWRDSAN